MIKSVVIQNYRLFDDFSLDLKGGLNIIVGNNEAGKSTILEAINLCLTKRLNGRNIENELAPYLFNVGCVEKFLEETKKGNGPHLPRILIELYLDDVPALQALRGTMNSRKEDAVGIKLEICPDEDFRDEYVALLGSGIPITSIPTEYFQVNWYSFANNGLTLRALPLRASYIDATAIRLQSGSDFFVQDILRNDLSDKERASLGIAYRALKESFAENPAIKAINKRLTTQKAGINDKELSLSVDVSQKANWEAGLVPHLDKLPFHLAGKGDQSALKVMLALERRIDVNLLLIEEPENHLSHGSMNRLLSKIQEKSDGKQIILSTHSAFVLNKLGLDNLILLANKKTLTLKALPADTQTYFKILSGYDTLRLILAERAILVEGPSDELVVQKAFLLAHGKLPIDAGVDVINVRGLSFSRFLDIARELNIRVDVVTDNDGDHKTKVEAKYAPYAGSSNINIRYSTDDVCKTLEPQLLRANDLATLNAVFGTGHADEAAILKYMEGHKTECALKVFEYDQRFKMPDYVVAAVA